MAPHIVPEASMVHFIYYDREIPTASCLVFVIIVMVYKQQRVGREAICPKVSLSEMSCPLTAHISSFSAALWNI